MEKLTFDFIDLFAGIGGFHIAMENLGGNCVYASEIDEFALETYYENFRIDAKNDITKIDEKTIPDHDVLCAGFPCQTFSKAGKQLGFKDKTRGTLFFDISRILEVKRPKFIILENVRNLVSHDNGNTWMVIKETLEELDYILTEKPIIMSPHHLGIPQLRERVYILGIHAPSFPEITNLNVEIPNMSKKDNSIYNGKILDMEEQSKEFQITDYENKVLTVWDEFYQGIKEEVIGFPVWSEEFAQNYNLDGIPKWKKTIIMRNRELYINNKRFIDEWLKKHNNLDEFTKTDRKFEWQAGASIKSIWDGIIQFRPSGVRVKRPDTFPALVAMVHTPIIGKLRRRLTPREAARLQSFPDSFKPHPNNGQAYKQFGNAVNAKVVEYLAMQLFDISRHINYTDDEFKQISLCESSVLNMSSEVSK